MHVARPAIALDPRRFGRGARRAVTSAVPSSVHDDLKLFATTFLGGFLFVSLLIA